ncbi:hypothetical protein RFI_23789 [Reticulomyxa filosa]|uniref:tRNA (guanine(9)-N(1))-methyltransferase n=1 Tax=Reticulomyxa filosa TaxID=46433 RepID=X6MHT6_RETFI|nr:hypothetical protein RFI_23789 [Reticulomyxa filosa]|eukprot:ETO13578.1 hypothetical protein RFI_23789 [Reticulomyxa filosa]
MLVWPIKFHPEKNVANVFADKPNEIIYLTPDCEEELLEFDPKCVYVIGGIVDRTVIKELSLSHARNLGIRCKKLPLGGIGMQGRQVMNIDIVIKMLLALNEARYQSNGEKKNVQDIIKVFVPKRKFRKGESHKSKLKRESEKTGEKQSEQNLPLDISATSEIQKN